MPQMSPYNWLMMNIYFSLIFFSYMIYLHYFYNLHTNMFITNLMYKKISLKW